jgi:hypothetical protein
LCGDSCNVGQDDADHLAVSVALLARAAAAPETPSEGQVLSPTVLPHACVWMMVMAVMLDRMTRTASKIMIDPDDNGNKEEYVYDCHIEKFRGHKHNKEVYVHKHKLL